MECIVRRLSEGVWKGKGGLGGVLVLRRSSQYGSRVREGGGAFPLLVLLREMDGRWPR